MTPKAGFIIFCKLNRRIFTSFSPVAAFGKGPADFRRHNRVSPRS